MFKFSHYRLLLITPLILLLLGCTPASPVSPTPAVEPDPNEDIIGKVFQLFTEDEDRDSYQVWDLANPDHLALQQFLEAYETAVTAELPSWWVQAPEDLALYFVYTFTQLSQESIPYHETFYVPAPPDEAVFITIWGNYLDDSVWGDKIRLELSRQNGTWEVVWIGNMWRCRRGGPDLEQGWHTTLCP